MSKFKSYAEKGSFGGSYIKLPDQVSKIREATQRRLSQMDRAQSFLQKSRSEYLSAQKDAQRIEADQRQANEERQRQARQDYIDVLKRDADIEARNTQAEIQQQEQQLRDIAQFSVTAFSSLAEMGKASEERRIEQANAIVLQTGLNHSDALAFANIDKTFTDQEAFASDEGQRILNRYGDTPQIREFLAGTRKGRGSYVYLQNKEAILNEVNNVLPNYLNETILKMDPNLDPSQKLAAIDVAVGDFVKQFNVDPRILEGIAGDRIRALKNQYKQVQIQNNANDERIAFTQQQIQVMNSLLGATNDNIGAVVEYITTNPSAQKNELFAQWAINRLNTESMTPSVYYDLFFKEQYMRDGKMVSFASQFKGTKWFVDVDAAYESALDERKNAYTRQRAQRIEQANAKVVEYINSEALADRFITREEENKIKNMLPPGITLEELPVYDDLKNLTNDARAAAKFEQILEERFLHKTITKDWINSQQLPPEMLEKANQRYEEQQLTLQDTNYKDNLGRVKDLVFAGVNGRQAKKAYDRGEYMTNADLYGALLERKFIEHVRIFNGDSSKAAAYVERWHNTQGGGKEGAWSYDGGGYVAVQQRQNSLINSAVRARQRHDNFAKGIKKFYVDRNVSDLRSSMSEEMIIEFQQDYVNPTTGIPSYIKVIAEEQGRDPFQLMSDLGAAFKLGEYMPGKSDYSEIMKGITPLPVDFKLNNTYRYVPERNLRAFNVPSSGRGKFAGQVYGDQLTQRDIAAEAVAAGFTTEQARIMSAIGMAESQGYAKIDTVQSGLDPNKENEYSIGIFQVNVLVHKDKLDRRGFTVEDMRDPRKNAIIAKDIYDERVAAGRDGYEPWSVYTNGKYQPHLEDFTF